MPYTAPTVNYSATINGTYTTLTGVQSVTISRGRQRFQDNFQQSSCVIELIPATSYALELAIGQFIDVRDTNSSSSTAYFCGAITDIQRNYSIPYNGISGYAPGDRITITASGSTGALGKQSYSNLSINNTTCTNSINGIAFDSGIYASEIFFTNIRNSIITFTGGAFDLVNQLLRTCQLLIDDLDTKRVSVGFGASARAFVALLFPAGQGNVNRVFSDAGTAGAFKFSGLEYVSSVQDAFTQVQVVPEGLATQTASTGSAPYNTLVYDTYNISTSDAASLAGYILATQNIATATPYSITTNTMTAPTCTQISALGTTAIFDPGTDKSMNLGAGVTVLFRGTTALAEIQGINTVFYPDYAQVQLYLSPSLGTPFTLDSSTFGVLDQNRLGYP